MALGLNTIGTALSTASSRLYLNTGVNLGGVKNSAKLARKVFNQKNTQAAVQTLGTAGGAFMGNVVSEAVGLTNSIHRLAVIVGGGVAGFYTTSGLKSFTKSLSTTIGNTLVKFMR
ncbi:MAG: hypothetical protein ACKO37_09765 [Vampirovibrionales bacterium]